MFCIIDSIYGKGGYYFLLHFTTHFEERRVAQCFRAAARERGRILVYVFTI